MIGIARMKDTAASLYLEKDFFRFALISESSKMHPLPSGWYVVRFMEFRESKSGYEYPFCRLIKPLGSSLEEVVLSLSELNPESAKEVLEIMEKHQIVLRGEDLARAKNLLNAIFLSDQGVILFKDMEVQPDPLLSELGMDIKKLRRKKHALLRAEQGRESQDL